MWAQKLLILLLSYLICSMVYQICGYAMSWEVLGQMAMAYTGKSISMFNGKGPYVALMRELLQDSVLKKSFDELFSDVQPVVFPKKTPEDKPVGGLMLIRGQGDPAETKGSGMFEETEKDKDVKKVAEECLRVSIGPFVVYQAN